MDFLNLVEGLKEETGVDIPESAYAQVRSLDGLAEYLVAHA
jgi:acyl carrier protein